MRPIVIMNPVSGSSRQNQTERVRALAAEYGDELYLTSSGEDALATAARAAREGRPQIIAAGGDDTVRQVLHGMYGPASTLRPGPPEDGREPTCFGILPTGTFNNFATGLGIPRELDAAYRLAHHGTLRWVDLGWIDGLLFTESIGVGLDVEAWKGFKESPSVWRRLIDGALAILRALYSFRPRRLQVTADGVMREVRVLHLTVANTPRFASAVVIAPHALIDDGKLDLCILPARSKLSFLAALPLFLFGRQTQILKDLDYSHVSEVFIAGPRPYVVRVDGKLARRLPVLIRTLKQALPMRLSSSVAAQNDLDVGGA